MSGGWSGLQKDLGDSGAHSALHEADELRTRRKEGDVLVPADDVALMLGGVRASRRPIRCEQCRLIQLDHGGPWVSDPGDYAEKFGKKKPGAPAPKYNSKKARGVR